MGSENSYAVWFEELSSRDVASVGGKNASLGEMISSLKEEGIRVPDGFATTAQAYREFLDAAGIKEAIEQNLHEYRDGQKPLAQVGRTIRSRFLHVSFPENIKDAIKTAYDQLCERYGTKDIDVAVRSSATAEDLPDASFAGQQETFLNVTGSHELLDACRRCYASLFTDRAISYREEKGFDHMKVALSVGVQRMVRSDLSGSGVMFSIDTETGFPHVAVINAVWGLGETVVQGMVNPDEYRVFKPLLNKDNFCPIIDKVLGDKEKKMVYATGGSKTTKTIQTPKTEVRKYVLEDPEILQLAKWAARIEDHYEMPMDMEWARDGQTGELFIVQARPETVQSQKESDFLKTYTLEEHGEKLLTGLNIEDVPETRTRVMMNIASPAAAFRWWRLPCDGIGLARGKSGLEVYVMCEIPSNVTLAEQFAERFDGFSIGSNDLTQLVLGVDRDSSELSNIFDERNEAVKTEISRLLQSAKKTNSKVGICGQAPSDYPDFAAFLVAEGIDSISLNPDSIIPVKKRIAGVESSRKGLE